MHTNLLPVCNMRGNQHETPAHLKWIWGSSRDSYIAKKQYQISNGVKQNSSLLNIPNDMTTNHKRNARKGCKFPKADRFAMQEGSSTHSGVNPQDQTLRNEQSYHYQNNPQNSNGNSRVNQLSRKIVKGNAYCYLKQETPMEGHPSNQYSIGLSNPNSQYNSLHTSKNDQQHNNTLPKAVQDPQITKLRQQTLQRHLSQLKQAQARRGSHVFKSNSERFANESPNNGHAADIVTKWISKSQHNTIIDNQGDKSRISHTPQARPKASSGIIVGNKNKQLREIRKSFRDNKYRSQLPGPGAYQLATPIGKKYYHEGLAGQSHSQQLIKHSPHSKHQSHGRHQSIPDVPGPGHYNRVKYPLLQEYLRNQKKKQDESLAKETKVHKKDRKTYSDHPYHQELNLTTTTEDYSVVSNNQSSPHSPPPGSYNLNYYDIQQRLHKIKQHQRKLSLINVDVPPFGSTQKKV